MVALGGCAWLLQGGHAWLLWGGRAWLLLRGMRGCSRGGAWLLQGGHAWLLLGGVCVVAPGGVCMGYDEIRRYDQ